MRVPDHWQSSNQNSHEFRDQQSAGRHRLVRFAQKLFDARVARRTSGAGARLAADLLDGAETVDGDRIGDRTLTDFQTMADDCLGTVGCGMSSLENLHGGL